MKKEELLAVYQPSQGLTIHTIEEGKRLLLPIALLLWEINEKLSKGLHKHPATGVRTLPWDSPDEP